jgi:hypothetical protein
MWNIVIENNGLGRSSSAGLLLPLCDCVIWAAKHTQHMLASGDCVVWIAKLGGGSCLRTILHFTTNSCQARITRALEHARVSGWGKMCVHLKGQTPVRGRLHLRLGCAVNLDVRFTYAFSIYLLSLLHWKLHWKRIQQRNAHPNCTYKTQVLSTP